MTLGGLGAHRMPKMTLRYTGDTWKHDGIQETLDDAVVHLQVRGTQGALDDTGVHC